MHYVDGYVIPVPRSKREEFIAHALAIDVIFKELGALRVVECWGNEVPPGKLTSFPLAVQLKDDEEVAFSWIEWPSKEVRDAAWKALENDPRMMNEEPPFDGKRLIYGGFVPVINI
jgi:uncharacterized protein YbaA (DUF1428 family)